MTGRRGGLFIGPLAAESGIATLVEALELFPGAAIDVVGVGPQAPSLRGHPQLRLHGRLASDELRSLMQQRAYLVAPGLHHEPQPLVMAFAEALPVIASRMPNLEDLVEAGRNGLLFTAGSAPELARRLAWAEAFPEKMRQMGECALADYQARFVAHWNWQRLYGERRRQARLHS